MNTNTTNYSSDAHESPTTASLLERLLKTWPAIILATGLTLGLLFVPSCSKVKAGPNGGDVVALDDGKTSAEMVANGDTGEIMVHTWDRDLKSVRPIEALPLTLGTDKDQIQLQPHPLDSDPAGYCSRFYGQADWIRGGGVHHGWLSRPNSPLQRQHFDWNRCWKAGDEHGRMWSEMGRHGAGMGQGGHGGMHK